ncbi:MAG TPA: tetratricopeptide repeat protein, partial [bacterium]|nr:tetratricopeptide repeat protein [bacterium]
MAYIYFQEGRWDKAIEEYKKLIALDPEDINTHNMLGDVYVKKGSTREAFEEYAKVSADFSGRGQADKAVIVNKKIAALDSSLLSAEAQKKQNLIKQTLKAETAMEQGDMDVAIEALTEVLKLDVENLTAFYKLGELYEKKGQTAEAVKQYQMLGSAFLKNRLFKKAQEVLQKVVLLDPTNIEARVNLAQIHIKQGSESDAKKEYLNAAEQAFAAGDLENANTYAAKAVELKSIEAHYVLGMVLFKKQKLSEAKAEFESLLRFKVNHVGALSTLGRVLLELGQADKAAESIQKALKLEKDNLPAVEAWVEVCLKKGNKPEAITNLGTLIDRYASKNDHDKTAEYCRALL